MLWLWLMFSRLTDACDNVQSFPLPGDFHFRFKAAFEGTYGAYYS